MIEVQNLFIFIFKNVGGVHNSFSLIEYDFVCIYKLIIFNSKEYRKMELQEFAKIKKRRFALVSHMRLLIDSL